MELKTNLNNNIYKKFIGFFIRKGKKRLLKNMVDVVFLNLSIKLNIPTNIILLKIFILLNSFVEIKDLSIKRRNYTVPFSLTINRRAYLVLKWLKTAIDEDERKLSFGEKLKNEILTLIQNPVNARSYKIKRSNNSKASTNRSNIHFRW
jgi:ribosomal protein S7